VGKRKLTDEKIIKLANTYANGCDVITVEYLSSIYHVSSSTISNALHYAITNCLVSEAVSCSIAEKAVRQDNMRRELLGYPKNNKVAEFYDNLIHTHKLKESAVSELELLNIEYDQLKNHYDTFDDTYSSSDEYPYTKDELKSQLDLIEEKIQKIKGHK
jgi:hypothetical protein